MRKITVAKGVTDQPFARTSSTKSLDLKKDIELNPNNYTVWFKKIFERVNSLYLEHTKKT